MQILSLSGKAFLGVGKGTELKKRKKENEEAKRPETKDGFPHIPGLPRQEQGFLHGPLLPSQCLLVYTHDS